MTIANNNQTNQNQPFAAGGSTLIGQKISFLFDRIKSGYLTPKKEYEVIDQEKPHVVIILDDTNEQVWIDMFDCRHTGDRWMVVKNIECQKKRLNTWCNNKDVKMVQLRSQAAGVTGTNKYDGEKVAMCSECRKANRGQIKMVKNGNEF